MSTILQLVIVLASTLAVQSVNDQAIDTSDSRQVEKILRDIHDENLASDPIAVRPNDVPNLESTEVSSIESEVVSDGGGSFLKPNSFEELSDHENGSKITEIKSGVSDWLGRIQNMVNSYLKETEVNNQTVEEIDLGSDNITETDFQSLVDMSREDQPLYMDEEDYASTERYVSNSEITTGEPDKFAKMSADDPLKFDSKSHSSDQTQDEIYEHILKVLKFGKESQRSEAANNVTENVDILHPEIKVLQKEDDETSIASEILQLKTNDDDFTDEDLTGIAQFQMDQGWVPSNDVEGSFIDEADWQKSNTDHELRGDYQKDRNEHEASRGHGTKASLAFVFDGTGSMWDDLVQVKEGAHLIMEAIMDRHDNPIENYVLVPFFDPEIGPATVTSDPEQLRQALKKINISGGGDCPEMAVGAIKLALELSLPNSFIYVFTDATAKDYNLLPEVQKLIQKKQSQIVFVMTGFCGDEKEKAKMGYQVFERIASTSSGQVFNLNKTEVKDVLKFVQASLQSRRVNLLSVDVPRASTDHHDILVDETLQEFSVSVTGLNPTIDVTNPAGKWQDSYILNRLNEDFFDGIAAHENPLIAGQAAFVTMPYDKYVRPHAVLPLIVSPALVPRKQRPSEFPPQQVVDSLPQLQPLLTLPNVRVVNVVEPDPGQWHVTVHSDSEHTVRSTGKSDFDFDFGFSFLETQRMAETFHRPLRRHPNSILIQTSDMESVFNLTKVVIVDPTNGTTLKELRLRPIAHTEGLYGVNHFVPSNDFFYLGVEGFGADGTPLKRLTSTTIQSQKAEPPIVHMTSEQSSWIGQPTVLKCYVESLVPFQVRWYKDGKLISDAKLYNQTADVLWQLTSSSKDSGGNFSCQATNAERHSTLKSTLLKITGPAPVIKTPETAVAKHNGEAVMDCTVNSLINFNVTWAQITPDFHNPTADVLIPLQNNFKTKILANGTLVIQYVTSNDEGWYLCTAENQGGKAESKVYLSMRDPIEVQVSPEKFEFQYGESFTLSCLATGKPAPTISWEKNGKNVYDDGRVELIERDEGLDLKVKYGRHSDEGVYHCLAENSVEQAIGKAKGVFIEPPTVTAEEGVQVTKAGKQVTLKCSVKGTPKPTLRWLKDGEEISSDSANMQVLPDGSLRISGVQPTDAGVYTCVGENSLGKETDLILLDVGTPPQFVQTPEVLQMEINKNASIPCMAIGQPTPKISWRRKDGTELRASKFETTPSGSLIITGIELDDGGVYVCTAENNFGSEEIETNVTVIGVLKPVLDSLTQLSPETPVVAGQRLALPCSVLAGNPPPQTTWYRDGEVLDQMQMLQEGIALENDTLVVRYATKQHRGVYECVVENVGGSVSQSTAVQVLEAPSFPSSEQKVYKVHEDSSVVIPCPALGEPRPLVTWEKDRMPLANSDTVYKSDEDNSLIITEASEADTGAYTCTAVNSAGSKKKLTVLVVQVPPLIFDTDDVTTALEGSVVTLYCEVRAVPTAKITWYRDEILVSSYREEVDYLDNGQGIRFVANLSDTGMYKCVAANEAGSDSRDMILAIMVSPSIHPPNDEHHRATLGQTVTLDCHVTGFPPPEVYWQRNGVGLSGDPGVSASQDGKLTIADVKANDTGYYVCDAENEAGITQKIFYLQVNVPPKILETLPSTANMMEGEDYSIPCSAHGNPLPEVTWRKDGQPIVGLRQEDAIVLEDGTLILVNASDKTSGMYTCTAENGEGTDQKKYIVQVLVAPSMNDVGDNMTLEVVEGDDVVMTCPAIEAIPPPQIEWLKDGHPLESRSRDRRLDLQHHISVTNNGHTLGVVGARPGDAGGYSCVASNMAGHTTASFSLKVLVLPQIEEPGEEMRARTLLLGDQLRLHCNVSGHPQPRVSWKKNNVPVTSHTSPGVVVSQDKQTLSVATVRLHDAGAYQCVATNKVGRRDQDFKVTVHVPTDLEGASEERVEAVKGSAILLHCPMTGFPEPVIKWTKLPELTEITDGKNVVLSKNKRILEISNTRLKDEGTIVCEGTNDAGSKTKQFIVTVLESPSINDADFSEDIKASEGKQAKLVCRTRGRPRADVVWLHNGKIVDMGNEAVGNRRSTSVQLLKNEAEEHILTIEKVKVFDGGKYTCLASNEVGVAEKSYRIKVLVAPRLANYEADSNMIESLEGLPVTIKCPVEGNPGLDIHWMKDSEPLMADGDSTSMTEGQVLHIVNSTQSHSGNYTCVAQNTEGNVSKSFQLDVLVPPSLADREEENKDYRLTTNDELKLVCNVSGHPPPNIQWFKGVAPISTLTWLQYKLSDDNKTLVIPSVHIKHNGKYSCLAVNMAGNTDMVFNVDVHEPPKMDEQNDVLLSNHTVKLHRRLVLKCPLSGSPQPTITWYKDSVPVKSGNNLHISSDGKQLHLMQALSKNAGEYDCVAENVAGTKKLHFNVNVAVPAEWSSWSEWSECSVICGSGEQVRARFCHSAERTGNIDNCQGESEEWRPCHMAECQIDGGWGEWSSWTSCSESCGRATRRRYRKCDNPEPLYGGQPCLGSDGQQEYCMQAACPVNGRWSEWTEWSECTASCDQGTKFRTRQCNNPAPAHHGDNCRGVDVEVNPCNLNKCPQHGNWAEWGRWSPCSTTCGPGNKRRLRTCTDPPPRFGGGPCAGENLQIEKCITRSCDKVPLRAALHVKGKLNGEQLGGNNVIMASISDFGPRRTVSTNAQDLLKHQRGWGPIHGFLLSPVSWNIASETDLANNGYSLTNGNFRQQSQIEFATGEELILHHVGRGTGDDGALHVDIEVQGEVPIVQPEANVVIEPFEEDYVQTGPSSLYASSTSSLNFNGKKIPFSWNNTVSYDSLQGTMPYLVERLTTRDIDATYDLHSQSLRYAMSTEIGRKSERNECPDGFRHDAQHLHCADVDECRDAQHNKCHPTQICENLFGSYRCFCAPGYKAMGVGKRCLDINECVLDSAVCSHQCFNTKGSFQCMCPPGFTLNDDGRRCIDARYWSSADPSFPADPYKKRVHLGLKRQRQDVSYADDATHRLTRPLDPTTWANKDTWKCPQGFQVANGMCQDEDECKRVPGVCGPETTCLNTKGSYVCLDTPCPYDYMKNFQTGHCMKFCDEQQVSCEDGALLTQTLSYSIVEVDAEDFELYQEIMKLKAHQHATGRQAQKTRYRIVENEKGKPFRVRFENGQGVLYALKQLIPQKVYRIIVLALSFDETGKNVLYTTRFVIYISLSNDS